MNSLCFVECLYTCSSHAFVASVIAGFDCFGLFNIAIFRGLLVQTKNLVLGPNEGRHHHAALIGKFVGVPSLQQG